MKIISLTIIDSTSMELRRLLSSIKSIESSEFLIIADSQTNGYGTHNRTWESPLGNLYMSYNMKYNKPEHLSYFISYSLFETISTFINNSKNIRIKWPNDILFNGLKVAGILIESFDDQYVVGIGVNLNIAPLKSSIAIRDIIKSETQIERNKFIAIFMQNLEKNKEKISRQGFLKLKRMWKNVSH